MLKFEVEAVELAKFAEKNGWIVVNRNTIKNEETYEDSICYLTPMGQRVSVEFCEDGSIAGIYP